MKCPRQVFRRLSITQRLIVVIFFEGRVLFDIFGRLMNVYFLLNFFLCFIFPIVYYTQY